MKTIFKMHSSEKKKSWMFVLEFGILVSAVMNLPTAMLPEEQVGWMFHRVCMKEAST